MDLSSLTSFSATWSAASSDAELARWSAFLAQHGVTWSADSKDRAFIDQMFRSAGARAGEMIELRLAKLANDSLKQANDARRVCKQISGGVVPGADPTQLRRPGEPGTPAEIGGEPGRRWYVLSPEQRTSFEQSGLRFDSGTEGAFRQLATIPITLGVYFAAQYVCTHAGLNPNIALGVALVAYVLTVRVVRGRWPLQPAR